LRNLQNLFFRIGKSIILLPLLPPTEKYIASNQLITKTASRISCKRGGEGGVKKTFFGFLKFTFENSAILICTQKVRQKTFGAFYGNK